MPAGGSAAAAAVAMAAGLVEKAARLSTAQVIDSPRIAKFAAQSRRLALGIVDSDAAAYTEYVNALRAARGKNAAARELILRKPRSGIVDGPLKVARYASQVADMASEMARHGNRNLRSDAIVALQLAAAAARAASVTLADNIKDADDPRLVEANRLAAAASELARRPPSPGREGGRGRAPARSRGTGRR